MKQIHLKQLLAISLLIISCFISLSVNAEGMDVTPYLYAEPHQGVVICTQLTVRGRASTNASALGRLKNGQLCSIVGHYNDWYIIDLAASGLTSNTNTYGFVREGLVRQDPYWIVTTQYTYLYASPWRIDNLRNGEQANGRVLLVVEENYPWYCVQCKETSAGSAFVRFSDIGQFSQAGQNLYVVAEDKVPFYTDDWKNAGELSRLTIADVIDVSGEYSRVLLYAGTDKETTGWVRSFSLHRIVN